MDSETQEHGKDNNHRRAPKNKNRRAAAARVNGKLSRGPITPAGKLAASNNRITHGMLAETVVLAGESKPRFDALLQSFVAAYRPITEPEHAAVNKMVVAYWRQLRTWSIQKIDFDREMAQHDPSIPAPFRATLAFRGLSGAGTDTSNSLSLALRYETTFERQFSRALRDLTQLKAQRDPTAGFDTMTTAASTSATSPIASSTWLSREEEEQAEQEEQQENDQENGK